VKQQLEPCLKQTCQQQDIPLTHKFHQQILSVTATNYFTWEDSTFPNTVERKLGNRMRRTGRTCTMMDTPEKALGDRRIKEIHVLNKNHNKI
jgi:hypothetical protein